MGNVRHSGYADDIARNALLAEVERIRPLLPQTEGCQRTLAAIAAAPQPDNKESR